MNQEIQLTVSKRENKGTGKSREHRRSKKVPGIIYGEKKDPIPILLDEKILKIKIKDPSFFARQCNLKFGDESISVLPKEIQLHPVKENILHIDFLRVGDNTTVTLSVPVKFVNENDCPGMKQGGVLNIVRHEVELKTLVSKIPEFLEAKLNNLEIGDSIHISSIKLEEEKTPEEGEEGATQETTDDAETSVKEESEKTDTTEEKKEKESEKS